MQQPKKYKNIAAAVSDMMKNGMQEYDPTKQIAMPFETYNLYDLFKYKLTDKAQKAIESVKTTNLIHQRNEEIIDLSGFWKLLRKTGNGALQPNTRTSRDIDNAYSGNYRRVLDKVMYLGKLSTVNKLEVAVDKVCNGLNRLANKGYITASLAPLIGISVMRTSKKQKPKIIVISYVAITAEGEKYIEKHMSGLNVQEGGIPKQV